MVVSMIFRLIKVVLVMICVMIIYTLLLHNVESKYFEIGVIRMLGLEKQSIILMILVQSFLYVVPAVILGFSTCIFILHKTSDLLQQEFGIGIQKYPTFSSSVSSLILGTVIPFASSIIPVRAALQMSMNDSLDLHRSKTNAHYINIL